VKQIDFHYTMKRVAALISWIALTATIVTPMVFLADKLELTTMKLYLAIATALWFFATPIWMKRSDT